MNITLKHLRYFAALADQGHFGRAAAQVSVTQPALSIAIRDLEGHLGCTLVERGAGAVRLTPVGQEVRARAADVLRQVSDLEQVGRWQGGLPGRLRLGVIPTIAPYLLPGALPMLRARNISLDLGVREAQTDQLLDELRAGTLDAAIMALPGGDADMTELPLFDDRFMLAGSRDRIDYLKAASDNLRPDEVDPDAMLLLDDGHCLTDQALSACGVDSGQARIDLRASSLSTLCRLVAEGFGLTFVPELALRREMAAVPEMSLIRFSGVQPRRLVGLVRRKLSVDDGWVQELAAILRNAGQTEIDHADKILPGPQKSPRRGGSAGCGEQAPRS